MRTNAARDKELLPGELVGLLRALVERCEGDPQQDLRTAADALTWDHRMGFTIAIACQVVCALAAALPADVERLPDPFETYERWLNEQGHVLHRFEVRDLLEKAAARIEEAERMKRADSCGKGV